MVRSALSRCRRLSGLVMTLRRCGTADCDSSDKTRTGSPLADHLKIDRVSLDSLLVHERVRSREQCPMCRIMPSGLP